MTSPTQPNQGDARRSGRWSTGHADTWGPYWDTLFPPREFNAFLEWKRSTSGVGIAKLLWAERQYLRGVYESVFGADPGGWPVHHPGVTLESTPTSRYAACLGCQWLAVPWLRSITNPLVLAHRHETTGGEFTGR